MIPDGLRLARNLENPDDIPGGTSNHDIENDGHNIARAGTCKRYKGLIAS